MKRMSEYQHKFCSLQSSSWNILKHWAHLVWQGRPVPFQPLAWCMRPKSPRLSCLTGPCVQVLPGPWAQLGLIAFQPVLPWGDCHQDDRLPTKAHTLLATKPPEKVVSHMHDSGLRKVLVWSLQGQAAATQHRSSYPTSQGHAWGPIHTKVISLELGRIQWGGVQVEGKGQTLPFMTRWALEMVFVSFVLSLAASPWANPAASNSWTSRGTGRRCRREHHTNDPGGRKRDPMQENPDHENLGHL